MYNELVNALRNNADHYAFTGHNGIMHLLTNAADAIEELTRENESLAKSVNEASEILRKRWIPVTEMLPDESAPVLAYVHWPDYTVDEICYGQYIKNGRFRLTNYVEGELLKGYEVKAWMPLPEPPKEGS